MKHLRHGDWKLKAKHLEVYPEMEGESLKRIRITAHVDRDVAEEGRARIGVDHNRMLVTLEGFVGDAILVGIRPAMDKLADARHAWMLEWTSSGRPLIAPEVKR